MLSPYYMNIKVKSTAVAIATVSSVLSFSVPSQAGEYEYLHELETMAKQHDVKFYLDYLSVSEKVERGKKYCEILEYASVKDIYSLFEKFGQDAFQRGYSERKVHNLTLLELSALYASVKGLCPEYEYKFNNLLEYSEEKQI